MLGPVFSRELLRAARRGAHHKLRLVYAMALALEISVLFVLAFSKAHPLLASWAGPALTPEETAAVLAWGLEGLVGQQFVVLLLAAPAFAAGALTDEKATGTLQYLLTTPLGAREIILGKWLALVVQLVVLSSPAVPLVVLLGAAVGLSVGELLALLVAPLPPLAAVVAASLLSSVWARQTTTAIVRFYVVLAGAGSLAWLAGAWNSVGPLAVLAAAGQAGGVWPALLVSCLAWSGIAAPFLLLAAWRLRPAFRKQLPADGVAPSRPARPRPPVGRQPIRWKERYWGDLSSLPLLERVPRGVGLAGVVVLTAASFAAAGLQTVPLTALALGAALLAAVLVAARCAGAVSGERERQTWDLLLLTPLEPRTLLRGKVWGVLDSAWPYLLAYLLAAAPLALAAGLPALVAVLFIWAASWPLMYFTAATGIECSVAAVSTWRGLPRALLLSFRTVLERFIPFGLPAGLAGGALGGWLASLTGRVEFVVLGFALPSLGATVVFLLAQAEYQLELAEKRIAAEERIGQGGCGFLLREKKRR